MLNRKGTSIVELLLVIAIIALLMAILLPSLSKARAMAREIKDRAQVRGVHQGMILFAQSNRDIYPIPSLIDKSNAVIEAGGKKDLPRHVLSVLIYGGFVPAEILVSPAEVNPRLTVYGKYQFSEPDGAVSTDKKLAAWDPAFKATPNDLNIGANTDHVGGCSYGMLPFFGGRLKYWRHTGTSWEAIIGNRGPAYDLGSGSPATWSLCSTTPNANGTARCGVGSNSLRIHGRSDRWEGHIAYNDNHVAFETRPDPTNHLFTFYSFPGSQSRQFDNLFVNEKDSERTVDSDTLAGTGINWTNNLLRTWYDTRVSGTNTTAIAPYWD